jgi:hypothetical protein
MQQPASSRSLAGRKRKPTKVLQEAVESRKTNDRETASMASQLSVPLPPPEVQAPKKLSKSHELKRKFAQFEKPKHRGIISSVYIELMKYPWNPLIPM